jgi:hypothetical protein
MTQVIQHDYGKSKVTLLEIRSAIKAVRNAKPTLSTSKQPKADKKRKSAGSRAGA